MGSSERFGPYRILRELGSGGMGRVSLAERDDLDTPVVVKRIHSEHAADPRFRRRLLREAEVAAGLQHPNVVRVLDTGVIDEQLYLAMEYVPGSSLAGILAASKPEPLPISPVLHAIAQACDGLHYVHRFSEPRTGRWMELVHRDVSVDNLLVSYSGEVKLADFGIVKTAEGTQTTSGVIMGKLGYMSPEQLRDETLDARSDLYSLGVCLFELLASRRPLPAQRGRSVMEAVLYDPPVPLDQLRPELPAPLVTLVMRLLAKDRKARPASAEEVAVELRAVLAQRDEPTLFASRLLNAPQKNRARPALEPATEVELLAVTKPQRLASPPATPAPLPAAALPPSQLQLQLQEQRSQRRQAPAEPPRPSAGPETAVAPPPTRRPAPEPDLGPDAPAPRAPSGMETAVAPQPTRRPSQDMDTAVAPPPRRKPAQDMETSVAPPPARRPPQEPPTALTPQSERLGAAYEVPTAVPGRTPQRPRDEPFPEPEDEVQSTRLLAAAYSRKRLQRLGWTALGGLLLLGAAVYWWWA